MNRSTRFAAAAVFVAGIIAGSFLDWSGSRAYAIDQTVEALRNVRYMHLVQRDQAGNLRDERWVEIGPDGYQARYRQDTPSKSFYVVDDRRTVMVYHSAEDKNTAELYDPNEQTYTWHYAPGKWFEDIAKGGADYYTVQENVRYQGRLAHHLRWVLNDTDIYIDPETKLPIACADYEISYEEPPEGAFEIVIPTGAVVVDKRPGAKPASKPQWMLDEERKREQGKIAQACFEDGRRALAAGDHARAIELLTKTVELSPRRNWAWLWLGQALQGAGDYDQAIYRLSRVIDMIAEDGWSIPSYYLARGMAYQAKGMTDMARLDMEKALPKMVEGLRSAGTASLFELVDDPLIIADGMRQGCHPGPTREQSIVMMINRLRLVTGQNFGYDPNAGADEKEQAIAAWEQWLAGSGKVQFTPQAESLPVPLLSPAQQLSRAIEELPYTGAGAQALLLLEKARAGNCANGDDWLKLGLALYDGKYYQEGLEAFKQAGSLFQDDPLHLNLVAALVWQGHILDLLGHRAQAQALYGQALEKDHGGEMSHDQYGFSIDRRWIEQRLETPFVRPD